MSLTSQLNKEKVIQFFKQSKSKITKKNSLISIGVIGLLLGFKLLTQNYIHTEYFTFDYLCKTIGPDYNERNSDYNYRFNPYWQSGTDFIIATNKAPNAHAEIQEWKKAYENQLNASFQRKYFNGKSALISSLVPDKYGQHHKFILIYEGDTYCSIRIFGPKQNVINTFLELDKSFELKD